MPGAGFIGATAPGNHKRRRNKAAPSITASVVPASSVLVVGQSLNDTVNWPVFLSLSNYATTAPGETIASVQINYIGSTDSASAPLADGDTNAFSVTVADTAGNLRSFATQPRLVVQAAPGIKGALVDQSLMQGTGMQNYAAAFAFTGAALVFSVSAPAGVSIDAATGLVSLDTDVLAEGTGIPVTVTASNSGGSVQAGFELTVRPAVVYATSIAGLTINPTHGQTAQIGAALTGQITPLPGSETVLHRWTADGSLIAGATSPDYTPVAGDDLALVAYAPLVNGAEVVSPAYRVRHAPPVAGTLAPVDTVEGGGTILINLVPGFSGDSIVYSETAGWATISGSTLSIDDAVRSDTLPITATNSGGQATVDLSVTIAPLPVTLISPIADRTLAQNGGDFTVDLRTVFANADSYSVSGPSASLDGDGYTLRIDDGTLRDNVTITATGTNSNGSVSDQFRLSIEEVVETDFVLTIETTTHNEAFTLPMYPSGPSNYSGFVDMGDGNGEQAFEAADDPVFTTIYPTPGTHTIRMRGQATGPYFGSNGTSAQKVRTVENLGNLSWTFMLAAFAGCSNMTSFRAGNCDVSAVPNFAFFCNGCTSLETVDITGMDFSSATNMGQGFNVCTSLTSFTGLEEMAAAQWTNLDEFLDFAPLGLVSGLDLPALDLSKGASNVMFNFVPDRAAFTQASYDAFLLNLAGQTLTNADIFIGVGDTPFTRGGAVETARTALVNSGVRIEDGGNAPPDQMAAPSLMVDSNTQITATLAADPFTNGLPISSRDLRHSTDLVNWTMIPGVTGPVAITDLSAGTQVHVQTRATNFNGAGAWSPSATATTTAGAQPFAATRSGTDLLLTNLPDFSPQTFTASVSGSDLVITFTGAIQTPAPTQVAVIDGANHDGTAPDAGAYDVRILDLGTAVDDVYTLSGVSVSTDAMIVLLSPQSDIVGGGFTEYERVVFIGASIMEQTFGSSLITRNAAAEAAFAANGVAVEVYSNAAGGSDIGQAQTLLSQAMAAFPEKTLFFVHAGGNNVTANRPYPGGAALLADALDGLIDIAATRPDTVIVSDLTFRDYSDTTALDEANGSKPYNDSIYLPAFQARQADLVSRAYYANGTPVSCLYEWSWENRGVYLGGDNIHPADPAGRVLLRDWLAARLAPICLGLSAPAQFVRVSPPPVPAIDIFVEYGLQTASGVNTPALGTIAAAGQPSEGPFALLNTDGSDPGVSLTLIYSAPAPGNTTGFGINTLGNGDGAAGFDGTLYSSVFTGDSYFVGAGYTLDHVISGLAANAAYRVQLVASRDAVDSRETLFGFADGQTTTIQTTADPTQLPATIDTVSDAAGTITITQSALSGSWSYLGGLRISTP